MCCASLSSWDWPPDRQALRDHRSGPLLGAGRPRVPDHSPGEGLSGTSGPARLKWQDSGLPDSHRNTWRGLHLLAAAISRAGKSALLKTGPTGRI
jgi:hypothetical protein